MSDAITSKKALEKITKMLSTAGIEMKIHPPSDSSKNGNTVGNTVGNTIGNTIGNTQGTLDNAQGNTIGNAQGNTIGNAQGNTQGGTIGNAQGNTFGNTQGAIGNAGTVPQVLLPPAPAQQSSNK